MPIGSSRAPIWRPKSVPSPPATTNYTLIRWEGWASSSGGTAGGANGAVYEIYIFTNGYIEARFGDWNLPTSYTVGIRGHYTSAGVGVAFANVGAFTSMVQNVTYVWDATVTNPTIYAEYTYVNGVVTAGSAVPSLGAAPVAPVSWPPAGWTNLTLPANLDDSFILWFKLLGMSLGKVNNAPSAIVKPVSKLPKFENTRTGITADNVAFIALLKLVPSVKSLNNFSIFIMLGQRYELLNVK